MRDTNYCPSSSPLAPQTTASTPRYLSPRPASPRDSFYLSTGFQGTSVVHRSGGGLSSPRLDVPTHSSGVFAIPPLASPRETSSTVRSESGLVRSPAPLGTSTTTLIPSGTPRMLTRRDEPTSPWSSQIQSSRPGAPSFQTSSITFNNLPLIPSSPPSHQQHRIDWAPTGARISSAYPGDRNHHQSEHTLYSPRTLANSGGPHPSPRQTAAVLSSPRSGGVVGAGGGGGGQYLSGGFELHGTSPITRPSSTTVYPYATQPTSHGWSQRSSQVTTRLPPPNSSQLSTPRTVAGVSTNHSVASPLADPTGGSPLSARHANTSSIGGNPARFGQVPHHNPIYANQTPMGCFRDSAVRTPRETPAKTMTNMPRDSRVGKSGAMTAREYPQYLKQSYKGDVTALPSGRYDSNQWHQQQGAQTHRAGGRGVLGKFLDSLKTTLGMHSNTPSAGTRAPRVSETVRSKAKPPSTATESESTLVSDCIQSVEVAASQPKSLKQPKDSAAPVTATAPIAVPLENRKSFDSVKSSAANVSASYSSVRDSNRLSESPSDQSREATSQLDGATDSSKEVNTDSTVVVKGARPLTISNVSGPVKPPRLDLAAIVKHAEFPSSGRIASIEAGPGIGTLSPVEGTTAADKDGKQTSRETPWAVADTPAPPIADTPAALGPNVALDAKTPAAVVPSTLSRPQNRRLQQTELQKTSIERPSGGHSTVSHLPKVVRFSWIVARALIKLQMQPAETFHLHGVPWSQWELQKIPTLGASPTSCRVQEMYKATITLPTQQARKLRVFVKSVPVTVWSKQWENQNKWAGEYVTDGENFVMEAAALAFLQQYGSDVAPKLLGFLELSGPVNSRASHKRHGNHLWADPGAKDGGQSQHEVTHIVIVSELYGEDLLDYLERRERDKIPLTDTEKRSLQLDCLNLLHRLHSLGLAHLDFTPENVLYGRQGLRLCDFAKATPILSNNRRHVKAGPHHGSPPFHFESCEPTVGKGAYMPPECWKLYWRLEDTRIQYPLEELWSLTSPTDRASYYFRVDVADVYMAGVLLFWLWSDGGIWKCSDTKQDEKYSHLVKSGLNFDLFRECRSWPSKLKELLQAALRPDPKQRSSIDGLISHQWFEKCSASPARDRWGTADTLSQSTHQQIQPEQPTVVA